MEKTQPLTHILATVNAQRYKKLWPEIGSEIIQKITHSTLMDGMISVWISQITFMLPPSIGLIFQFRTVKGWKFIGRLEGKEVGSVWMLQ